MSGVDCLLTTWGPDQKSFPQATISNLILFNTTLVEQTLPWRRQRVPLDQEAGPLLRGQKCQDQTALCFVHLGDPEIWNTGLALRRR